MGPTVARTRTTGRSRSGGRHATGAAHACRGRSPTPTPPATSPRYDRRMATAAFESLNPSTGEVIESFPRSGADDVERAVATARAAWEDWRLVPAPERG